MISVDKEASIEAIKAGERVFTRFGSTRLLGYGMLVGGVGMVLNANDKPSDELLVWGLGIVATGFLILAVSYIFRPHDHRPRKLKPAESAPEEEK